ncbi:hypothetical protein V498_02400 [Pseudogymnoascus sp. VKM F-4517 (FW-2822)]|nr:hypothetical protein V498_02400 [Pseudogymnoascus sp. VKM F-4517 (FW-2822)]
MDITTSLGAMVMNSSETQRPVRHLIDRSLNKSPLEVVFSEGNYLHLSSNQIVFDATCGAGVSCLGYGNDEVIKAITDQLWANPYSNSMLFTTGVATQLAEEIILGTGNLMSKVYICSSGSEATEAAMKMARQYFTELSPPQRRTKYIAREHSYHGNTLGALAVSGHYGRRETYLPILSDNISWVSACNPYRQRLPDESDAEFVSRKAVELDAEFQRLGPDTVIAFVCEPISGAALGCIPYVYGYLPAMKAVCRKYGALFILDETMCGMGRSGNLHAWQGEHVAGDLGRDCLPDLQMIGKGLGGGYQPIAGVILGKKVIEVIKRGTGGFIHGQTYQAHPVACAAALAVQRIIQRDNLLSIVCERALYLSEQLREKLGSHRYVGDIRGMGLFWGIEFVQDKRTKAPFPKAFNVASMISEMALKDFKITLYPGQGTANGVDGDHVIVAPTYTIRGDEVDYIVHKLASAVDTFFSRQAWESKLGAMLKNDPEGVMDSNRLREVQQVQDALRKSEEAREAVTTLMDSRLHWSLNPTITGIIFRVASTYRILMEAKSTTNAIEPSVLGCNPGWAIDVIKKVSKTTAFDACCHELLVTIPLTDLPEAMCDAFGSLISITLLATEKKELRLKKSEMLGVLEESEEWLDTEQESYALWNDYEELTTELEIDGQITRLDWLRRLREKGSEEIGSQEKQLETEKEALHRATQDLQQGHNGTFLFETTQVQFKTSQLKILEGRLAIQKSLQGIREGECDRLELKYMESMKCIEMQKALCLCQGVMDDNGNFKQPRKGAD